MEKTALRKAMRQKRQQLGAEHCRRASALLIQKLIQDARFIAARKIAFYFPFQNEIDPLGLLYYAHGLGKSVYLPVLDHEHGMLHFAKYRPGDRLSTNRFGILEPLPTQLLSPHHLDLVFVPLVAFDNHGHRLGSGQGYYDRSFAFLKKSNTPNKPILMGLAYDWQRIATLQVDHWDVPLSSVLTA